MENTPEVENKYKELSFEDKQKEIEQIKSTLSEEESTKVFTVEADATVIPEVDVTKTGPKLDPQLQNIGQALFADAKSRVLEIYADYDISGIEQANLDITQKASLMSTVALPNAKKMATIEKNLKSKNAEGTPDKNPEFSKPESTIGDKDAGAKIYSTMSQKLGIEIEESN